MDNKNRVQAGVPRGGQFAASRRSETSTVLAAETSGGDSAGQTGYPPGDWRAFGYTVEEAQSWAGFGFDRAQADGWRGFGFNASEATIWHHPGFTPSQARSWESTPASVPHIARRWADAGFDPEHDREWLALQAPEAASAFREAGWTANTSREWMSKGFDFDEANAWRSAYPGVTPQSASVFREQGQTPDSLQANVPAMPATRAPNPLRKAGPFRSGTVAVAERGGATRQVDARIVGRTLAVHQALSGRGWSITHVGTGRSVVPPIRRKADAEQTARTLAVVDPQFFANPDLDSVREAAQERVFVRDGWFQRGQLPKMVSEAVQRPHSASAAYVQHLLAHPIGEEEHPQT